MTYDFLTKSPRLYTDQDLKSGGSVVLGKDQAHYLKNVLRKGSGDVVRLFNGRDGEWAGALMSLSKKEAVFELQEQVRPQPAPAPPVHLLFAPIQKNRMDMIIEKGVELGCSDFHPIVSVHTEVRRVNEERINAQIIEAAEQSERFDIPVLHPLEDLEKKLRGWDGPVIHAGLERLQATPLGETKLDEKASAFLIGPVGGFSNEETSALAAHEKITAVSLGETILRCETAALFCLSFARMTYNKGVK